MQFNYTSSICIHLQALTHFEADSINTSKLPAYTFRGCDNGENISLRPCTSLRDIDLAFQNISGLKYLDLTIIIIIYKIYSAPIKQQSMV